MTTTTPRTLAQQPWEPALSVRQALGLERVRAGQPEVVAGAHRLDRPVRWVHVAEAADVGVMLSGGEMVLTTGVLLAGDEEGQGSTSGHWTAPRPPPSCSASAAPSPPRPR